MKQLVRVGYERYGMRISRLNSREWIETRIYDMDYRPAMGISRLNSREWIETIYPKLLEHLARRYLPAQ